MSQNWKRRRWTAFQPHMEQLEAREVPAGNIQAFVANGVLTIRSDDDFHAFSVSGAGGNNVVIRPFVGTTINGQTENIWVGGVRRGYDIQTGNGADTVIISGVNGRDYLSIVTNGGDDAVHIVDNTQSRHSTWIRTGDGDDVVIVNNNTFNHHFALLAGGGNDRVDIGPNNSFGRNALFDGGDGTDPWVNSATASAILPRSSTSKAAPRVSRRMPTTTPPPFRKTAPPQSMSSRTISPCAGRSTQPL